MELFCPHECYTWMMERSANGQTWKMFVNCKNNIVYETFGKNYWLSTSTFIFALYFKLLSLFNFILSQTNRKIMHLPTLMEQHTHVGVFKRLEGEKQRYKVILWPDPYQLWFKMCFHLWWIWYFFGLSVSCL